MNTKDEIMEVAMGLFASSGYHKTTMDQIAKEANVAKGTLYWHFSSKQELFLGILESDLAKQFAFLEDLKDDQNLSSQQKIEMIVDHKVGFFLKHQSVVKEVMRKQEQLNDQYRDKFAALREKHGTLLADIFKQGVECGELNVEDPTIAASALVGMLIYISGNPDLVDASHKQRTFRILKDLILNGILSKIF